jgi:aldose 1-epimerase
MHAADAGAISVERAEWGPADAYAQIYRYTMRNQQGITVAVSNLGASLVNWLAPDRHGGFADIVLGFDTPAEYVESSTHMGGTIGRVANRISGARFDLDGHAYTLEPNDGANTLHGGWHGFDRAVWHASVHAAGVRFEHTSPNGDSGFPGKLTVGVDYRLDASGALSIDYTAQADAPTPLNLTCHPYFNLAGQGTALDHLIQVDAATVLATDAAGIPTAIMDVDGTALDFRLPARLRERVASDEQQIRAVGGVDHCFVLRDPPSVRGELRDVASAMDPASGRRLTISTTQAGLQVYTATNLEGVKGRDGQYHHRFDAVCFEAQGWPDQIHSRHAESCILRPGRVYRETTVYRIDIASDS